MDLAYRHRLGTRWGGDAAVTWMAIAYLFVRAADVQSFQSRTEVTMRHASKLRRDLVMDAPAHSRCASRGVIATEHKSTNDSFRRALEAVPAGIVLIDSAGVIVFVNLEFESTFGYARVELIGQCMDRLVPGYSDGNRQVHGRELYGLHKDGRRIPIEVDFKPLATPCGDFVLGACGRRQGARGVAAGGPSSHQEQSADHRQLDRHEDAAPGDID